MHSFSHHFSVFSPLPFLSTNKPSPFYFLLHQSHSRKKGKQWYFECRREVVGGSIRENFHHIYGKGSSLRTKKARKKTAKYLAMEIILGEEMEGKKVEFDVGVSLEFLQYTWVCECLYGGDGWRWRWVTVGGMGTGNRCGRDRGSDRGNDVGMRMRKNTQIFR